MLAMASGMLPNLVSGNFQMTQISSINLQVEHYREALSIGNSQPRLSWIVTTDIQGWYQAGYEIEQLDANGKLLKKTGKIESDQSVLV
ncbi:MAG: hypothetical protein WAT12_10725, partial [Candidatus Nitrotoga sp.]